MIRLEHVAFSYPSSSTPVFNDLTLTVDRQSWVVITGPDGSGKTTLCRILKGLAQPTDGRIVYDDAITTDEIGYLGGDPYDSLVGVTVLEDVVFGMENLRLSQSEMESRLQMALEWTGLRGMERRLVHTLSGGEQQKLSLAGVLAMGCKALIVDDALSMLDRAARTAIQDLINSLRRERGLTVIEAASSNFGRAADRIVFLSEGKIAWDSAPEAFFSNGPGMRWIGRMGGLESFRLTLAAAVRDRELKFVEELIGKIKSE
jgi:energy-coupling factor transport system ATP-binding protein